MPSLLLPTEGDVRVLVYNWYRKLDQHLPVEDYLPLLSDDCRMVFPEETLNGKDAFSAWYRGGQNLPGVINLFFDEVHELKHVDVALTGASAREWQAAILIVVKWEARRWAAPDPKSAYLAFDAWQRWTIVLSGDNRPVIREYIVDRLEKLAGSVDL
jgi:hypothetical protein